MSFGCQIDAAQSKKMDFQEFCAAATSVPQLEGLDTWDEQAKKAYEIFEKEGNRVVLIEDLARVSYFLYCEEGNLSLFLLSIRSSLVLSDEAKR